MNTSILSSLKEPFSSITLESSRSTVELCVTELASGNYSKAVILSEELIKKDINDSVGWAIKALSQAELFDYDENLYYLKSALSSIEEFKKKTLLNSLGILNVESIFITTVLQRTIALVTNRINEVIQIRQRALEEKSKAKVASSGALLSAYAGFKSKSDVGQVLGLSGAAVAMSAASHFRSNAKALEEASKGVFGVAVANISLTVPGAVELKENLHLLQGPIEIEAREVLRVWIKAIGSLYKQVIENLLALAETVNPLQFIDVTNTPEATQFLYLSKILGMENSSEFQKIEKTISDLKSLNKAEIERYNGSRILIAGSVIVLGIILIISEIQLGSLLLALGFILLLVFAFNPQGEAKKMRVSLKNFKKQLREFKIISDTLKADDIRVELPLMN